MVLIDSGAINPTVAGGTTLTELVIVPVKLLAVETLNVYVSAIGAISFQVAVNVPVLAPV